MINSTFFAEVPEEYLEETLRNFNPDGYKPKHELFWALLSETNRYHRALRHTGHEADEEEVGQADDVLLLLCLAERGRIDVRQALGSTYGGQAVSGRSLEKLDGAKGGRNRKVIEICNMGQHYSMFRMLSCGFAQMCQGFDLTHLSQKPTRMRSKKKLGCRLQKQESTVYSSHVTWHQEPFSEVGNGTRFLRRYILSFYLWCNAIVFCGWQYDSSKWGALGLSSYLRSLDSTWFNSSRVRVGFE